MKVVIPREARFVRTPDGALWIQSSTTYEFWRRYLDVFDAVQVLARVLDVESVGNDFNRSDGPGVEFVALPYYMGPREYLRQRSGFRRTVAASLNSEHAVLLRSPGQVSAVTRSILAPRRPYGVEVVGDPQDAFARGAVRHPLRAWFRWTFTRDLRQTVARAAAVSYVTETTLQRKYPPAVGAFTTHYSSIELGPEAFVHESKTIPSQAEGVRCVMVGSLDQMYKGPDVLIRAVAECKKRGLNVSAVIVGDGAYRAEMHNLARNLGIEGSISFRGQLPSGAAVRAELDSAEIFVLPSRSEGLPRAMIEAMARGLPCIGTNVGGIPELLPPEDMVVPNDPTALAGKIQEVVRRPERLSQMSTRNLEKASEYRSDVLRSRRVAMYTHLKGATLNWQAACRS